MSKVIPPLVALLMADSFYEPIINGDKKITIREGIRDYKPGQRVVLCYCPTIQREEVLDIGVQYGWAVMARITEVSISALRNADIQDLKDDGMESVEDAVNCLQDFYPDITEDSPVTVIRWELI